MKVAKKVTFTHRKAHSTLKESTPFSKKYNALANEDLQFEELAAIFEIDLTGMLLEKLRNKPLEEIADFFKTEPREVAIKVIKKARD